LLVNVKCYGVYGSILGGSVVVELCDKDGIIELLELLEKKILQSEPEAPPLMERGKPLVKLLLNGIDANLNTPLQDGDNLALFPVIGGG
jgi:molybdopterin converting factor small subunit